MEIHFEGWYNDHQEKLMPRTTLKKEDGTPVERADGFFVGFPVISGSTEKGKPYSYEAVRVFIYVTNGGKTVASKELVPWHDGEEVIGAEIPLWLQEAINKEIKQHPLWVRE